MRAFTLLSSLLLIPASLASAAAEAQSQSPQTLPETTHKLSIYTQPLTPAPGLSRYEKLAKVIYTYPSLNTTVEDYDLPSFLAPAASETVAADDIIKLGFYSGKIGDEDTWHGIATAAGSFAADRQKTLKLYLDSAGKVWHLGFSSVPKEQASPVTGVTAPAADEKDTLRIELVPVNKGPLPHLNKPIIVNKDGKKEGEDEEENKTFLQKYWWAIAIFLVLQVVMGGGGDK